MSSKLNRISITKNLWRRLAHSVRLSGKSMPVCTSQTSLYLFADNQDEGDIP